VLGPRAHRARCGPRRHRRDLAAAQRGVQLDNDVPVFSVVLTPHHFHEHSEHVDYYTNHFVTKGAEAARAVANTLSSLRSLPAAR
ncbi:6,7-dimethyl-8-ribityllumazine synthase, partial [Nocardia sp. NPDC003648]